MQRRIGPMRLTRELAARIRHTGEDRGLPADRNPATDSDHAACIHSLLDGHSPADEVWLFTFGSLIWNPAFESVERRIGVVRGWHRAFCLGWDHFFRGSDENPGLMLSLDRGGACKGVAYRLPPDAIEENLLRLMRREILLLPSPHVPRWVGVRFDGATQARAIAFVIDRKSDRYVGGLDVDAVADVLARAAGPRGSMAEYLFSTVSHLESLGLRDPYLWRLQEMVADRIEAATAGRMALTAGNAPGSGGPAGGSAPERRLDDGEPPR